MNCVKAAHTLEYVIKKSRFIGIIMPCATENDVLAQLKQLHSDYPDASHIVYAYRLQTDSGISYRFHDAGEPTGTAGKPVFQQLDGNGLINVLLVVVRYFGGVKLGAGGLTRAYGKTAKQVIDEAQTFPYIEWASVPLTLAYNQLQPLEYLLKKLDGRIVEQDFAGQIRVLVALPAMQVETLRAAFPACY
jgi:uncharacterized YigZ family protein